MLVSEAGIAHESALLAKFMMCIVRSYNQHLMTRSTRMFALFDQLWNIVDN